MMRAVAAQRSTVVVRSRDRELTVASTALPTHWWQQVWPHLPGVPHDGIAAGPPEARAHLLIRAGMSPEDGRRLVNAHLHGLHLRHGTLCVHAVSLLHPSRTDAVSLLGGHGAGKTLVALALVRRGWRIAAGDVTLLDCRHPAPLVSGGTSALIGRRDAVRHWFPRLGVQAYSADRVDLGHLPGLDKPPPTTPATLRAAVVVDVDGSPYSGRGVLEAWDRHTSATVWLRASGHLLDRVLEGGGAVLRQRFEDVDPPRARRGHVRVLAGQLPLYAAWGTPHAIAERAEYLADVGR
jgi:hypothetical protein